MDRCKGWTLCKSWTRCRGTRCQKGTRCKNWTRCECPTRCKACTRFSFVESSTFFMIGPLVPRARWRKLYLNHAFIKSIKKYLARVSYSATSAIHTSWFSRTASILVAERRRVRKPRAYHEASRHRVMAGRIHYQKPLAPYPIKAERTIRLLRTHCHLVLRVMLMQVLDVVGLVCIMDLQPAKLMRVLEVCIVSVLCQSEGLL